MEANDNRDPVRGPEPLMVDLSKPHWIVAPNDYWFERIWSAHKEGQEDGFGAILSDAYNCPFWVPLGWRLPATYPIHQDRRELWPPQG